MERRKNGSETSIRIQQEIHRHDLSHFIDEAPSVAEGGKGVVVGGCPACRKGFNSMNQFLDHLAKASRKNRRVDNPPKKA